MLRKIKQKMDGKDTNLSKVFSFTDKVIQERAEK